MFHLTFQIKVTWEDPDPEIHINAVTAATLDGTVTNAVLWIRIQMFLGLLDLDPLVRGTDPARAPDPGFLLLWLLNDFLSKKNDVNGPSKSNKQKNLELKFLVGVLKVKDENSKIRIRIHWSKARIRGSGSVQKCQGSTTLNLSVKNICTAQQIILKCDRWARQVWRVVIVYDQTRANKDKIIEDPHHFMRN